tara:strand:- start:3524 stop:4675 length:1152 start_codon:yes stop_codon:yes gene_type:complete
VSSSWQQVTIKDIAVVDWGNTNLTKKAFVPEGPYLGVSAAGCDGRMGHAEHKKNTPVLSAIGAQCGRMFLPQEDFTAIKNTITLTPLEGVTDPVFLYYLLTFVELPQRGAGQPFISKGDIQKFPVPLPPLEEQKRIVAVLDTAFEGLAHARAHAEANLQNARELFENYRENFLAPSSRQGWSYRKLDALITIKHGFAFKSAFFVNEGQYAVLTPGNYYETGGFRDRGEKQRYYSGEFPSEFLLRKGDLLMAMTEQAAGLLGSCMIVPEDEGYLHNQRLGLISSKDGVAWSPEYFSQAFNLKAFRKGLSDTCSGATVRHTSPGRILTESIPYTDNKAELEAVALHLAEREQDCRTLEKAYREKLQDLDDLRQSLLQKAFVGELT